MQLQEHAAATHSQYQSGALFDLQTLRHKKSLTATVHWPLTMLIVPAAPPGVVLMAAPATLNNIINADGCTCNTEQRNQCLHCLTPHLPGMRVQLKLQALLCCVIIHT